MYKATDFHEKILIPIDFVSIPHRQCITCKIVNIADARKKRHQFLIGNVQHYLNIDDVTEAVCQFLISNVQQQHLSTVFFIILPIFLKINHFPTQKYVDLFYVRIATARMFTGLAGIFLLPENLILRSTYFFTILGLVHFSSNF